VASKNHLTQKLALIFPDDDGAVLVSLENKNLAKYSSQFDLPTQISLYIKQYGNTV